MDLSFYTVDDLRLLWRHPQSQLWRLRHFNTLFAALAHYQSLPSSVAKSLGVSFDNCSYDLIRCLPLFPTDLAGADILLTDSVHIPLEPQRMELIQTARQCVSALSIRYCLEQHIIFPAPQSDSLPPGLASAYLWPDLPGKPETAVKRLFVANVGWLPLVKFREKYAHLESRITDHPLVTQLFADGLTEGGQYRPLEVSPAEYHLLLRRTKQRIRENHKEEPPHGKKTGAQPPGT